jgi:hypothetical protein
MSQKNEADEINETFSINRNHLSEYLLKADKIPLNFTKKAIINRLIPFLKGKLPLTELEIRKLLKIALNVYSQSNELALEKVGMLNTEDKIEAFQRLKRHFLNEFYYIFDGSPQKSKTTLEDIFNEYFKLYIPVFE